jgi:hypothetical protein
MINLKAILSAVARAFGVSSPEDLRKQKCVASKSTVPRLDPSHQQSHLGPDKSSDDRSAEPTQR